MTLNLDSAEARFALQAVKDGARLAREIQHEMVTPALTKDDHSPVTVADFGVQAVIGRLLYDTFPQDRLVAEESASALRQDEGRSVLDQTCHFIRRMFPQAEPEEVLEWIDRGKSEPDGRFWTLDPVDGTKGFLRGDQYAVALALVVDGRVEIGALGCPDLQVSPAEIRDLSRTAPERDVDGTVILAIRGAGSWSTSLNGQEDDWLRLSVSHCQDARRAKLLRSFESGHTDEALMLQVAAVLGLQEQPVLMDSQAKYAVLAAGKGDLLFRLLSRPDYREKIWDQAAGSLAVEEAGGRVTDLEGKPLDFTAGRLLSRNRGLVASNGYLHEVALEAVKRAGE